jgi:NAD-dependent DNA ligase
VPRFLNDRWIATVFIIVQIAFQSQFEALQSAREWGFKPQEVTQASNLEQVFSLLIIGMFRHELPYETDGVVVKLLNFKTN